MRPSYSSIALCVVLLAATTTAAQSLSAVIESSYREAARDTPALAKVLGVGPGMSVADVGAGFGGWSLAMARLVGPEGTVIATEIGELQLATLREMVAREGVSNVTVIEGAGATTNLPAHCCEAVFMRNVYHHLPQPEPIIDTVFDALKPGGRLAIIDFVARPGSALPAGVRKNRGGNGIPAEIVVEELKSSRFRYVETITPWPPDSKPPAYFVVLFEKPAR